MSQKRVVVDMFDTYQDAYAAKLELEDDNVYQIRRKSDGFALVRREFVRPTNDKPEDTRRGKRRNKREYEGEYDGF